MSTASNRMGTVGRASLRPFQLAAAIFVVAVGLVLGIGAFQFPVEKGYSILGPQIYPYAVSVFLIGLGAVLTYQTLTGGYRGLENVTSVSGRAVASAAWVTGGLIAMALLIVQIGFVLAGAALFTLSARGFGSRRTARDLAVGISITLPVYWIFSSGLGVSLPPLVNAWI